MVRQTNDRFLNVKVFSTCLVLYGIIQCMFTLLLIIDLRYINFINFL